MTLKTKELVERLSAKNSKVQLKVFDSKVKFTTLTTFVCQVHGEFLSSFSKVLNFKYGCKLCRGDKKINQKPKEHYIDLLKCKGYEPGSFRFSGEMSYNSKIEIKCKTHGWVQVNFNSLMNGHGCKLCGYGRSSDKQRKLTVERIMDAWVVHGYFRYDYSLIPEYVKSNKVKVPIVCIKHGLFYQRFNDHLQGKGCKFCAGHNAIYSYVHLIKDGEINVCLKYGVTKHRKNRMKELSYGTDFTVINLGYWVFLNSSHCIEAEKEVKNTVPSHYFSKGQMNDGFTETCQTEHLDTIIKIFEKNGGKRFNE